MSTLLIQPYWHAAKSGVFVFLSSLCVILVVYFCAIFPRASFKKRWVLPPGPQGAPLVGNLLQMRKVRQDAIQMAAYASFL